MTKQTSSGFKDSPEVFVIDEWVDFYEGEQRTKVQITDVKGSKVTARVGQSSMTFSPRASDGMFVKVGSPDHEIMPTMIYHADPEPQSRISYWRRALNFIIGK